MNADSPHRYRRRGRELQIPDEILGPAVRAREAMSSHVLTPVITLANLAVEAEVDRDFLRAVVARITDPYELIPRRKRDGTVRNLAAPTGQLMQVQRWILHNLLNAVPNHPRSFAYQKNLSIVDCADVHVDAKWLVKMDLHDFFGQVPERRVYHVFADRQIPRRLSSQLAAICTRPRADDHRNTLPQGAPTSGALANAVATRLDALLEQIANDADFHYTRYSDDLTFSTRGAADRETCRRLVRSVTEAVFSEGFTPHQKKTRIIPPGSRKIVLGLLVDREVRLLPEFRRRVRNHVRGVDLYGLPEHAAHRKFDSVLSFVNHIEGSLAFAQSVDGEWTTEMRSLWHTALEKDGYMQIPLPRG